MAVNSSCRSEVLYGVDTMHRKYSKGPWHFEEFGIGSYIISSDGDVIAGGEPHEGYMDETNENHILMCSAPELLEALEEVVAISDRKHNAWDKAKAAIAKAKGGRK